MMYVFFFFFFFQAEDGIRDVAVTGVQTCALPISPSARSWEHWNRLTQNAYENRRLLKPLNVRLTVSCFQPPTSGNYRGDQLGDSLCPCEVNPRAWVPSASMIQICQVPERVDWKTMCLPSGAQLGRSFRPASRVSSTICRVATSMT